MKRYALALLALAFAAPACSDKFVVGPDLPEVLAVAVSPETVTVDVADAPVQFTLTVTVKNGASQEVRCSAEAGTIDENHKYTFSTQPGTYKVTCLSVADPTKSAVATVTVVKENLIAFSGRESTPGGWRDNNIYIIEPDGKNRRGLMADGVLDAAQPAWSPDGRTLAFRLNGLVRITRPDGSTRPLVDKPTTQYSSGNPTWSADGSRIAFEFLEAAPWVTNPRAGIAVADTDGAHYTELIAVPCKNSCSPPADPTWSPDGKKIAFTANLDSKEGIFLMNPDGTDVTYLGYGWSPAWSPDGSRIALAVDFSIGDCFIDAEIHVMNADGSDRRAITHASGDFDPAWSPDGERIVFASNRNNPDPCGKTFYNADLYVMNADGSNVTRLTETANLSERWPAWRP